MSMQGGYQRDSARSLPVRRGLRSEQGTAT